MDKSIPFKSKSIPRSKRISCKVFWCICCHGNGTLYTLSEIGNVKICGICKDKLSKLGSILTFDKQCKLELSKDIPGLVCLAVKKADDPIPTPPLTL